MNIFEFIVIMAVVAVLFILGLALIAGKYNLLSETNKENKNGKR